MKPKIEEVVHGFISKVDSCCLIDYSIISDTVNQINFATEYNARSNKIGITVGMWKIKTFKNNYHAN